MTTHFPSSQVEPVRPADGDSLEQLSRSYNHRTISEARRVLTLLILRACREMDHPPVVLDIGCGQGLGRNSDFQRAIAEHAATFIGVDPDPAAAPDAERFDAFHRHTLESAPLDVGAVDLAYAHTVLEHITDPHAFLSKVYDVLRPGGQFLFLTPNGRSYFGVMTRLTHALRIDEMLLAALRGRDRHAYHFPVTYRCNDAATISRLAADIGFDPPLLCYTEEPAVRAYFPGPLRPIYWVLQAKRRIIRNPRCLISIIGRMTKPRP
jgi:SAM-dependent methyltransferase